MKKFLLLASMMLVCLAANAAIITANCTAFPVTFTNGAGSSSVTCPGFTPAPGELLTAVSLSYSADYQFGIAGTNSVQVTFTPQGPTANWSPASTPLTVTGGISSGAIPTGSANYTGAISNAVFANSFNVNVSSQVLQGAVATSSGAAMVNYTFTPSVPEPSTFVLLGSALAAVGIIRRRRTS